MFLKEQKKINEQIYDYGILCTCGVYTNDVITIIVNKNSHYSGNFWWATTDYLATLPDCINQKAEAEFWLHRGNPKYQVLHNSNINHYHQRYQI